MLFNFIKMLFIKMFIRTNYPIPGKDADWNTTCDKCTFGLVASRGGFKNGGIQHCYGCGHEKEITGFRQCDIDRMITSSWVHWRKFPIIPYNWHELSEEERQKVLRKNK